MNATPTDRPLVRTDTGWVGSCLTVRCYGNRTIRATATRNGTEQVATVCGSCGRVMYERVPGADYPTFPGRRHP